MLYWVVVGVLIKVTVVDSAADSAAKVIKSAFSMIVDISLMTVGELKCELAQRLNCNASSMCCALNRRSGIERLTEPDCILRNVGFGLTTNKVITIFLARWVYSRFEFFVK